MNREQHLLCKLAEECNEVAQMALKSAYFGLGEVYGELSTPLNNAIRTHIELDDLMAIIELLNEEYKFEYTPNRERIEAKKKKVNRWAEHSKRQGLLNLTLREVMQEEKRNGKNDKEEKRKEV